MCHLYQCVHIIKGINKIKMRKKVIIKFPVELPDSDDQDVINKGKEAIVLELLRMGKISQGKASELLEINRYDLFDLMAKYKIPVINMTPEELERELKQAKDIFRGENKT